MQEFAPASMKIPKRILRRIPIGILSCNFVRNSDGRRSKRFDFAHRGAPATALLILLLKPDILKRHKIIRMTGQRILLDKQVNALEAHLAQ